MHTQSTNDPAASPYVPLVADNELEANAAELGDLRKHPTQSVYPHLMKRFWMLFGLSVVLKGLATVWFQSGITSDDPLDASEEDNRRYIQLMYMPSHTRFAPFVTGMLLGATHMFAPEVLESRKWRWSCFLLWLVPLALVGLAVIVTGDGNLLSWALLIGGNHLSSLLLLHLVSALLRESTSLFTRSVQLFCD